MTDSLVDKGNERELTTTTHERVRTLADLIRVCEIDTAVWSIERWVANKWEMGYKDKAQAAHTVPLFQIKVWLKRKVELLAVRDELAALVKAAKRRIPALPVRSKRQTSDKSDYILELAIPDLHLGKLAWGKETGWSNYDSTIAKTIYEAALSALLERTASYTFSRILLVIGNDLFNADNTANTTTRGTAQDTDGRYFKTFVEGREMITRGIDRARSVAPVAVVVVPGNHDTVVSWHLGDSLACLFQKTADVAINNEPTQRKYHQFGKVMLMFTHGDKGKRPNYPQVMAAEQPTMWGATRHREAHTGHLHQLRVEEQHGVKVRISPALCPPDAWHSEHQFVGNARAAEAFVWHREEGLVGTAVYTVPEEA